MGIQKRKAEHLNIAIKKKIEHTETAGFEDVVLEYDALPELNLSEINLKTRFLGRNFEAPLMVSAITGGTKEAQRLNKLIALSCEHFGIGFGLGSQRAMLEHKNLKSTFYVRDVAPNIFLAANIGVAQLSEYAPEKIAEMVDKIEADALAIHLNALQEAVQPEGDKDFEKALENIQKICKQMKKPVYVKEVGHGISHKTALKLNKLPIKAIDVQGSGGTSWAAIEQFRGSKTANHYWNFGIPTIASILCCKKVSGKPIIASGGIRHGLDSVKSLVLGSDLTGIALPVLQAAAKGPKNLHNYLDNFLEEMRIGFLLTGSKNLTELRKTKYAIVGRTKEIVDKLT
ncbi:MAG: type 2 isopentenyl-diphosphate Delta-isomerase [archaeon]